MRSKKINNDNPAGLPDGAGLSKDKPVMSITHNLMSNCILLFCMIAPFVIFVYVMALALCNAARMGDEQGEREMREWMERRDGQL